MDFLAVNWLAIVLATVASMALGAAWYGVLSAQWLAASGRTKEDIDPKDFMPYVWSVIVQLVMAYFLAVLTPPLAGAMTIGHGLQIAFLMWLGFVATSMILNHRYQGKPWSLTVIDSGYILAALLVQGLVLRQARWLTLWKGAVGVVAAPWRCSCRLARPRGWPPCLLLHHPRRRWVRCCAHCRVQERVCVCATRCWINKMWPKPCLAWSTMQ